MSSNTFARMRMYLFLFYILLLAFKVIAQQSDKATTIPIPYEYDKLYKKVDKQSVYITMPDGVKLAANVYLPKGLEKGQKVPSILYQTRYWRSIDFRWPVSALMEMVPSTPNFDVMEFVRNGYALIALDVRGTGASFGVKTLTLPSWNEVQDGAHVVDWIVEQEWSNGKVGATGISYIGITALYLAINQHPAVKAIAPMYSIYDLYDDIGMPGGVFMEDFLDEYGNVCGELDRNRLVLDKGFLAKLLVKGVEPVKGKKKEFEDAVSQHACNVYQKDEGGSAEFIDNEHTLNGEIDIKYVISPHLYLEELNNSNIPVYSYSGWWDLAFTGGAVKQFLNFNHPSNKLILGPWSHGGPINVDPSNPSKSEFDHIGEIMKFFDQHLKNKNTRIESEPPVHYFTMGEGKWKSSESWPPNEVKKTDFYFSADSLMSQQVDYVGSSFSQFISDTSTGTGEYSRWNLSSTAIPKNGYPNRQKEDRNRLYFQTNPLNNNIEVTGHPVIKLWMTSSQKDAGVFAYLEDVDENGKVTRVTEGLFRTIHKKVHSEAPHYKDVVPYHSYKKDDASYLSENDPSHVVFDLLPTSYLFESGHKIRIAICGNDKDYFKQITPHKTRWDIYHSSKYPSSIELPIMERLEQLQN